MKTFLLSVITGILASAAQVTTSSVYECHFQDESSSTSLLRLKESFDPAKNADLGQVDVLIDGQAPESIPTSVYQVVLLDNKTYIQIWYSKTVRVDAQMTVNSPNLLVAGTYNKAAVKRPVMCRRVVN